MPPVTSSLSAWRRLGTHRSRPLKLRPGPRREFVRPKITKKAVRFSRHEGSRSRGPT
jgi:hypothetical protein